MKLFRPLLFWVLFFIIAVTPLSSVRAQNVIEVQETGVNYSFGGQVTFWAKTNLEKPPEKVQIFLKSVHQDDTIVGQASVRGNELVYVHDLVRNPLPAFSEIQYWFGITMPGEQPYVSPKYSFFYDDNRFSWQMLEDKPFRVHWYEGDLTLGQMVLDVAQTSLKRAKGLLGFKDPEKVDIFVYANGAEMRSTLNLGDINIVAGHADPELGVMFVTLPTGPFQQVETERQIPHELMHILVFQKLGPNYVNLPTWFQEGLASLNETYQNPDYVTVLKYALEKKNFLPMSSLCHGFTVEGGQYQLAYAQADSFTRYLYDKYHADGIQSLIQAYMSGLDCERGAEAGLGKTLTQLDDEWQQVTFNQYPLEKAIGSLLPWIFLMLLMLLTPILLIINSLLRGKDRTPTMKERSSSDGG